MPHSSSSLSFLAGSLIVTTVLVGAGSCAESEPGPAPSPAGPAVNGFLVGDNAFTQAIPELSKDEHDEFIAGRTLFVQSWVQAPASTQSRDGLGPLFNSRACENCHPSNGRSSPLSKDGSLSEGLLFRVGSVDGPDPVYGGQIQGLALPGVPVEMEMTRSLVPLASDPRLMKPVYQPQALGYGPLAPDSGISPRIGGSVAGLGLLEAVDPQNWIDLADPDDLDQDGISGRVHWFSPPGAAAPRMGRFGWKAEMPDILTQSATAFHEDMGLTTSLLPDPPCTPAQKACLASISGGEPEIVPEALEQTTRYVQLLAVPLSPNRMPARQWHRNLARFEELGCADCHVPSQRTRTQAQGALRPLADIEIWPFTDLLLHDMGPELADGRALPGASPQEWRTPPLWGIGHYKSVNKHQFLMHDGRANGISEAIAWHGGEGRASKEAFFALSQSEQAELIAFIEQL